MNGEEMQIVRSPIVRGDLRVHMEQWSSDFVKAVVDVGRGIMAVGSDMHSDEEQVLLRDGSRQEDLWGINLFPDTVGEDWIQFDSMINMRPRQRNRSRGVEDAAIREKIRSIVDQLIQA